MKMQVHFNRSSELFHSWALLVLERAGKKAGGHGNAPSLKIGHGHLRAIPAFKTWGTCIRAFTRIQTKK